MTTSTLLGVTLAPLFSAIAQVESCNGQTSENVYQLSRIYVDDVNRILAGNETYTYDDVNNRERSEHMMEIYLAHYCMLYTDETGRLPTWETMARIHNGGPKGWSKYATKKYWRRVKQLLPEGEA